MAATATVPCPGYHPRSPVNPLKDIVEDCLEEFLRVYDERYRDKYGPLHPRVKKLFEAYCRCGDLHFGFIRWRCPKCGENLLVPFSCKARGLCPSCGMRRAIEWAERMVSEVLPDVPYVQLVFTIPKMLRRQFLFDRELFGDLCRVAYASVKLFFKQRFPEIDNPLPAMIAAPQSFGSLLNFHPHCHAICSLGVFDHQGNFHTSAEVDFAALEKIFQKKMLKLMLKKKKLDKERVQLLTSWEHSGFHIDSSRRIAQGDRSGLEAVLQYLERPPISLERLTYQENGVVHYRGKFNPNLQRDYQLVPGVEFLAMLVPHINLKYEITIRYYGAISSAIRKKWHWIKPSGIPHPPIVSFSEAAEKISSQLQLAPSSPPGSEDHQDKGAQEEADSEFIKARKRNWAYFIAKVYLDDPTTCPRCGEKMIPVAAISSPAQDDIIKKILVSRGQWDPPWKKARPPRGPPPQNSTPESPPAPESNSNHWVPDEEYFNSDFPDD